MSSLSSELLFLDDLCDQFEAKLRSGDDAISIPRFLDSVVLEEDLLRDDLLRAKLVGSLLQIEWDYLCEQSVEPDLESYLKLELLSPREIQKLFFKWEKSRNKTALFENYQLITQLGQGRFGTVWQALDLESNKLVAIKIAHPSLIEDCEQFLRESRAAVNLRHPHIANLIKSGQWKGRPFIVREYIEGQTLTEVFRDRILTPTESAELTLCLAKTLAYSHSVGCIHRDLKPGNILIQPDGNPILIDFGLAKTMGSSDAGTASGIVMGTPVYMAPEQARGDSHAVDARSDVYSLGVVLFEALTGRRPFEGGFEESLYQVLKKEPTNPRGLNPKIPHGLSNICLTCLRKDPKERYQTSDEFAQDLQRFLNGESVSASPEGQVRKLWRFAKSNPAIASWAACSFVLLLSLALVSFMSERSMRAQWQTEARLKREAIDARRIAEQNAEQANLESALSEQITVFLNKVFLSADPLSTYVMGAPGLGNPDMTATEILDQAATRIESELPGRPRLQARLLAIVGGVNCNLGRIQAARELLGKARLLLQQLKADFPEKDFRRDDSLLSLNEGRLYHYVGEYQRASDCFEATLKLHEQFVPQDEGKIAEILLQAGWLYIEWKKPKAALICFERLRKLRTPLLQENSNLMWAVKLVDAHCRRQKLRFAWLAVQAYFSIEDRQLAGLVSKVVATQLAKELKWYDVALPLHRRLIKEMESRFAGHSRWNLLAKGDYASTLFDAGYHADALDTIRPLMVLGKQLAPNHPHIKSFYGTIGSQKLISKQYDDAIMYLRAAQDNPTKSCNYNFEMRLWLVEALIGNQEFNDANVLLPAHESFPDHGSVRSNREDHVWYHVLRAKIAKGLRDEELTKFHLLEAKKLADSYKQDFLPSSIIFRHVWLNQELGQTAKVQRLLELAVYKDVARFPKSHPRIGDSQFRLGEFLFGQKQIEESEKLVVKALRIRESRLPSDDPRIAETRQLLANIRHAKSSLGSSMKN